MKSEFYKEYQLSQEEMKVPLKNTQEIDEVRQGPSREEKTQESYHEAIKGAVTMSRGEQQSWSKRQNVLLTSLPPQPTPICSGNPPMDFHTPLTPTFTREFPSLPGLPCHQLCPSVHLPWSPFKQGLNFPSCPLLHRSRRWGHHPPNHTATSTPLVLHCCSFFIFLVLLRPASIVPPPTIVPCCYLLNSRSLLYEPLRL